MTNAYIPTFNPPNGSGSNPKQVEIAPQKFKHNLIDTKKVSITDIITMISGAPWTTVYFQQVLGSNQQPLSYQNLTLQVYQQYRKINNLVMAVQQGLQQTQDTETAEFVVSGSALTYPKFVPTKFDHFYGPVRDGQMGLFVVTEVQRKSFYEQSVYEINYELVDIVTPALNTIFQTRVVEELYFNMSLLRNNSEPYLNSEQHGVFDKFKKVFVSLSSRMIQGFYSNYTATLMVPSQPSRVFDPFLIKAFQNIFAYNSLDKTSFTHYKVDSLTARSVFEINDPKFS
jgi:hypothetical protein